MAINKASVDFIQSLDTDELEIFCGLDTGKSRAALATRLYGQMELVDRYETGRKKTGLAQRKADKWRYEANQLVKRHAFLPRPSVENLFEAETIDIETGKAKNVFSTDIFYTLAIYFTRVRLFFLRLNKILLNFSKNILPGFYVYLGIVAGAVELIYDTTVLAISSLFGRTRKEKKPDSTKRSAWEQYKASLLSTRHDKTVILNQEQKKNNRPRSFLRRLVNSFMNENRPTRMLNTFWFALNLACFLITGNLLLVALLTIAGTLIDIGIDTGSASFALSKHRSLSNKLDAQKNKNNAIDPAIRGKASEALTPKTEHTTVTRVLRLFNYNTILSIAMIFIYATSDALLTLSIAIPYVNLIAIALMGFATLLASLELINFKFPSAGNSDQEKKNRIDKIRVVTVLTITLAALAGTIAVAIFPPLVFAIPFLGTATLSFNLIGASLALLVGSTGLVRALAFGIIDKKWTIDKFNALITKSAQFIESLFNKAQPETEPEKTPLLSEEPITPGLSRTNSMDLELTSVESYSSLATSKELLRESFVLTSPYVASKSEQASVTDSTVRIPLLAQSLNLDSLPHTQSESTFNTKNEADDKPVARHARRHSSPGKFNTVTIKRHLKTSQEAVINETVLADAISAMTVVPTPSKEEELLPHTGKPRPHSKSDDQKQLNKIVANRSLWSNPVNFSSNVGSLVTTVSSAALK